MILAMCDFSRILVYPKENPQSKIPWPVKAPCLTQLPDARQGLFDEGSLFEKPSENYRGKQGLFLAPQAQYVVSSKNAKMQNK